QAGSFLGSTGRPVFCPAPSVTVVSVQYGCVTSGTSALGPNGSGVLATLTFRANNFGSNSVFGISAADLGDPLGNDIPVQRAPYGSVESSPAVPTATPSATPAASGGGGGAQVVAQSVAAAASVASTSADVNGDCVVNVADVQDVASRYGATLGTSRYLPSRDVQPA